MTNEIVRLRGVGKSFSTGGQARAVLREVDLVVARPETIAIVGPSGSGKTTLILIMAGIERADSGTIDWPGCTLPLRPAHIGIAFQGQDLLPPLTVLENTVFPMLVAGAGGREADERAREMLEKLGLASMSDKLPGDLSGGEAARSAIARALVLRPDLVILDEPTGQLDHRTAATVIDVVLRECEDARSALVVATHDEVIAARLARRFELRAGLVRT